MWSKKNPSVEWSSTVQYSGASLAAKYPHNGRVLSPSPAHYKTISIPIGGEASGFSKQSHSHERPGTALACQGKHALLSHLIILPCRAARPLQPWQTHPNTHTPDSATLPSLPLPRTLPFFPHSPYLATPEPFKLTIHNYNYSHIYTITHSTIPLPPPPPALSFTSE